MGEKLIETVLNNSWLITVGGGITVNLAGYYIFGIGRSKPISMHIGNSSLSSLSAGRDMIAGRAIVVNNSVGEGAAPIGSKTKMRERTRKSKLTPQKIMEHLNNLPSYQQDEAAKHYIGIYIGWKLALLRASRSLKDEEHISVTGTEVEHLFPMVRFNASGREYPELKLMKRDDELYVEGEIEEIEVETIHLKNCQIKA